VLGKAAHQREKDMLSISPLPAMGIDVPESDKAARHSTLLVEEGMAVYL
jgi:hypothetical protein